QCVRLLAHRAWWITAVLQFPWWKWIVWRRQRAGHWMVGIRSFGRAGVFTRLQLRLLDDCGPGCRIWNHRWGHQSHLHDTLPAMPRDAPEPHAPAAVARPGDVRRGSLCSDAAVSRADHAACGSLSGGSLLRYASGRIGHTLDALLLDIRTSRGVHPGYSRLCFYVGDRSGIFPKTDFRIPNHGRRHDLYRLREHERVGAPHVHRRDEFLRQQLFRDHFDGGGYSDGNQDLQLDRNDVGRENPIQDTDAILHRISVSVSDRRPHRNHASVSPV